MRYGRCARRGVRTHATPQLERLGRLLDQHAQPVQAARRALLGCPAVEGSRLTAVHHVVADGMTRLDQARRNRRQLTTEAGGSTVDDQVHRRIDPVEASGDQRTEIGEFAHQLFGLGHGTVGDHQHGRLLRQEGFEHTAHGTAGTQHEDALAGQAEASVVLQITSQAGTVGVVTQQAAVCQFLQGIYRAGATGALGEFVGQAKGLFLERHGDVAAQAFGEEGAGIASEIVQRCQACIVGQHLAGLLGEQAVDQRRFAVADGVAEDAVAVHGKSCLCRSQLAGDSLWARSPASGLLRENGASS